MHLKWYWKSVLFVLGGFILGASLAQCQTPQQKLIGISLRTCYSYLQSGSYDIRDVEDVKVCVSNDYHNAENANIATNGIKSNIPIANLILEVQGYMATAMPPSGRFGYYSLDQWHQAVIYVLKHPRTDELGTN